MKKIFITTAALLIACTLSAADLFVSPEGNDRNPGTKDSPKATPLQPHCVRQGNFVVLMMKV